VVGDRGTNEKTQGRGGPVGGVVRGGWGGMGRDKTSGGWRQGCGNEWGELGK